MIVYLLIQKILSLLIIVIAGMVLVKIGMVKTEDSKSLSAICVYLMMPCSILVSFQIDCTPEHQMGLALAVGAAFVVQLVMLLVVPLVFGKIFHLNAVEKASIIYPNSANLVLPLVAAILGDEWMIYASGYITVQMFLLWSHGKSMLSGEPHIDIKKIVTNSNIIAIAIGLVLFFTGWRITGPFGTAIKSVSDMLGPTAMLITGILVGSMNLKKIIKNRKLWVTTILRLIVMSGILMILLKVAAGWIPFENANLILMITLLACIAPSASAITQLASIYDKDADYASAINMLTTILCVITMPIMIALYQM